MASRYGMRMLWIMTLATAFLAFLASIFHPTIQLFSFTCGHLCGESCEYKTVQIALSIIITGIVLSPSVIRKHKILRTLMGIIASLIILLFGLVCWIS
jgi:hypothetical protein